MQEQAQDAIVAGTGIHWVDQFSASVGAVQQVLSGYILLPVLLLVGAYLTIGLGFMPIRRIPYAFGKLLKKRPKGEGEGDVSPFGALMTALSATIGTGNIAGVALAIYVGGPGALFWMWMTALVGMASKYAEGVLAVRFREVDASGRHVGGPMYYIRNGMGKNFAWLAAVFAFFGMLTSFVTGNTIQSNSVAAVLQGSFSIPPIATGVLLAFGAGLVILGGVKRIAQVASALVPSMAGLYVVAGLLVIALNASAVPHAFAQIFEGAFTYDAAEGGFFGSALWLAIRFGVARGIFSNEAGQGSAPIAHAAAKTRGPVDQGIIAMLGTFLDTICVCSITGLVILTTGVAATAGADIAGPEMTAAAFGHGLPTQVGAYIVTIGLALFAFTTILGWSYYGERCAEYLFGEGAITPYRIVYVAMVFGGSAVLSLQGTIKDIVSLIWLFGDSMTALMATPNLIALAALSPLVFKLTREYFAEEKAAKLDLGK